MNENIDTHSYIQFNVPDDVTFDPYACATHEYLGRAVLLDKGKYVRTVRFNCVVGKTSPEFFEKVLTQLATTFDFTKQIMGVRSESAKKGEYKLTDEAEPSTDIEPESTSETESSTDIAYKSDNEVESVPEVQETVERTEDDSKKMNMVSLVQETFETALNKLDASKDIKEQVNSFLADIGMPTDDVVLRDAFFVACNVKKITFDNVALMLQKMHPNATEDAITAGLRKTFKEWLKNNPELVERCPRITLIAFLKAFANANKFV